MHKVTPCIDGRVRVGPRLLSQVQVPLNSNDFLDVVCVKADAGCRIW